MSDEELALRAAILAAPADEAPRLVYADHLDEQAGERNERTPTPRAEFIRVQCELPRVECPGCRPDYPCREGGLCRKEMHPLRRRERELLKAHFRQWFTEPVPWSLTGDYTLGWPMDPEQQIQGIPTRGFIGHVSLTLAQFVGSGDSPGLAAQLGATCPLEGVRLEGAEPSAGAAGYGWSRHQTGQVDDLPAELWDLIEEPNPEITGWIKWFPTVAAAHAALSDACVRLARERAGVGAMMKKEYAHSTG